MILDRLKKLYPEDATYLAKEIDVLIQKWKTKINVRYPFVNEKDAVLITYGDSILKHGEAPLKTLHRFWSGLGRDTINTIHILPMFPFTSDDGFSVVDFKEINAELGSWKDIKTLHQDFFLMFDAVLNHCSASSSYFKNYLNQKKGYETFFKNWDPSKDYSKVTRPRTSPLLTQFETVHGIKNIWTTFSADQVDINYESPQVLLEMLDVLLLYVYQGARFIRYDAIGFLWKKLGTTCMHLEETHEIIKLTKEVIQACAEGVEIITETNVAHHDNISYFGNGYDEAGLVYQFPLPPLTLNAFITESSTYLTAWAKSLQPTSKQTTFFNFLSSHDGIGLRPVEGILPDQVKKNLLDTVISRGARVNYRTLSDGTKTPYEMCITYMDALSDSSDSDTLRSKRFLAAHSILLSLSGLPAIYIHSLLGSRNDIHGADLSGINRRINREKLNYDQLIEDLSNESSLRHHVFYGMKHMLKVRRDEPLFSPHANQVILELDHRVFAVERQENDQVIINITNVSSDSIEIKLIGSYQDLITNLTYLDCVTLKPYQYGWFKKIS
ncbi:MAG: sugar phosphorylase [Tenericutes bacterium GWC2_34_14]|nr:MAG: sugar phosphorylase [Tenericutes bacterium GWC2_34_14]OHE34497.1 MAG: sugar phosphorylase [Tenericutes bacterium GWE2_34_108]OHE35854.1 MAG: sugar phosphorylase [Tenericutes bacterium GWF1_35_14]OHE39060.1 MAG: sugar phosphorylase [Tenericutes bacterium GWF2_35_184]OHE42873.1 MAG: sugar phosphorylase [Tenericutes bacterium RIFOXYA2_FULL_36_32]OHE46101.1 MAG: sugar phosphorylase [Tenericutes bacterium RIFOXYB2_FULL_36_25]OHE46280.1 MAG: sugar phosphorylase [Tenericutes bacterium RIFOXY